MAKDKPAVGSAAHKAMMLRGEQEVASSAPKPATKPKKGTKK